MDTLQPAPAPIVQDASLRFGDFAHEPVMSESADLMKELDQSINQAVDYAQAGPSHQMNGYPETQNPTSADDQPEFELVINRSAKKPAESKLRRQKKK
jgi:hypothetical protein